MLAQFLFNETSPAAAGAAASSKAVASSASWAPTGVAAPIDDYESIGIDVDLQGATGGTLDVYIQQSPDQGLTWYDVVHFPQLAAGAPPVSYSAPISQATNTAQTILVGKNLAPALGLVSGIVGAVVNGAFSDRMRLVMVAGAGTSAGAPVVVRLSPQRARTRELGG